MGEPVFQRPGAASYPMSFPYAPSNHLVGGSSVLPNWGAALTGASPAAVGLGSCHFRATRVLVAWAHAGTFTLTSPALPLPPALYVSTCAYVPAYVSNYIDVCIRPALRPH